MEIKKEVSGFEVTVAEQVFAFSTFDEVLAKVKEVFGPAEAPVTEPAPEVPVEPAA